MRTGGPIICLETSSYLPLVWRTPYSQGLIDKMSEYAQKGGKFFLQRDCIKEAAGYLSFKDADWRYSPSARIDWLLRLSDQQLASLGYPSTAVQILAGGNIWPQARYLNFVRHTIFFFADLLDGIDWIHPRQGLVELQRRVNERIAFFRNLFQNHVQSEKLRLPDPNLLPYWGKWYLPSPPTPFTIEIFPDPPRSSTQSRDIYHYVSATTLRPQPDIILVANTKFVQNVRSAFPNLTCPVECATPLLLHL